MVPTVPTTTRAQRSRGKTRTLPIPPPPPSATSTSSAPATGPLRCRRPSGPASGQNGGDAASTYRKPVAWINVSGPAAPTGAVDAHESLRKVLGYVDACVIDPACLRLPLTRDSVGADGQLSGSEEREQLAAMLRTLDAEVDRLEDDS